MYPRNGTDVSGRWMSPASGRSRYFEKGKMIVIYRKRKQWTICLLYGKRRLIEKHWADTAGRPLPRFESATASSRRISESESAYDRRSPHHCRSAVHTRPPTVGDRAFPVAAARTWNDLPRQLRHVRIISACFPKPSEDAPLPAFFSRNFCSVPVKWLLSL